MEADHLLCHQTPCRPFFKAKAYSHQLQQLRLDVLQVKLLTVIATSATLLAKMTGAPRTLKITSAAVSDIQYSRGFQSLLSRLLYITLSIGT